MGEASKYGESVVRVVMTGAFGTFRTKTSDVKVTATHVALVFAGGAAAEDLDFEPPLEQPFDISFEMSQDGTSKAKETKKYRVAHFGLRTRLDELGVTVVVLPLDTSNVNERERRQSGSDAVQSP